MYKEFIHAGYILKHQLLQLNPYIWVHHCLDQMASNPTLLAQVKLVVSQSIAHPWEEGIGQMFTPLTQSEPSPKGETSGETGEAWARLVSEPA